MLSVPGVARSGLDRASETMIGLRGWACGWSGREMQRGGGRGDGAGDDHEPEPARPTGRRRRSSGDREQTAQSGSRGGRVGVTYKYFGAPDGATAARVPISMRPEELGGDEL